MKTLVIGCGSIGKRHIGNLANILDTKNIFAVDPKESCRNQVHNTFKISKDNLFETSDQALESQNFDSAIIATPTSLHHLDIIKMAARGVNLMIEKPVCVNTEHLKEIESVVSKSNKFSFVAYCFRFDPVANKFSELIKSQYLGKPLYSRAEMSTYLPDWHPEEDYRDFYMSKKSLGGGTLLDQSHLYDMVLWFFGEVKSVFGISKKHSDLEMDTDDFGEFIFNCKSGLDVSVHVDLFTKKFREFFQVTCEKGTLNWDIGARKIYAETEGKVEILAEGKDYNQMYINEMKYFIEQVKNKGSLKGPNFNDGIKVLHLIEAIRNSSSQGQLVYMNQDKLVYTN
ncbi:MAG TPA: Gfo/Idh/MocA family oxidoreductase [Gammaproteobacteria bacterium]|nr:Gfo/Idh/MocA family oxidoreductase [Gammaproteobacteria bacterium]